MDMCNECSFDISYLMRVVNDGHESTAWNIAVSHGMTKKTAICPSCHTTLYLTNEYNFVCFRPHWTVTDGCDVSNWQCNTIIDAKKGTIFNFQRLIASKLLALMWYFLDVDRNMKYCLRSLGITGREYRDWFLLFNEVVFHYCSRNCSQIGGGDKVVEIEVIRLGKRVAKKYPWMTKKKWILAGVESEPNRSFVVSVDDDKEDTLIPVIQQYIHPGTSIVSYSGEKLTKLWELGYQSYHNDYVANDLEITSNWRNLRYKFFTGPPRKGFDLNVNIAMFCFLLPKKRERYHRFLLEIGKLFPPGY